MKKAMLMIVCLLVVGAMFGQDSTAVNHDLTTGAIPLPGAGWSEWLTWGISILLFAWEVIVRLIPTAKDWTLISKMVSILDWIVSLFNGVGNAAKMHNGQKAAFKKVKTLV